MKIILASESPRRRELLEKIAKDFKVIPSEVKEQDIKEKDPITFAIKAATSKAKDVGNKFPESLVIGADTVVALGKRILGKPRDKEEAREMLYSLSGKEHKVITALALYQKSKGKLSNGYEVTHVKFKNLTPSEIEDYLRTGDHWDKAGSYAVQKIGDRFVERIKGDYENVVGLPLKKLTELLEEFNENAFTLEIVDIALPNNWGVGKREEFTVFVPEALVGDTVKVEVLRRKKSFAYGRIIEVKRESTFRVPARCENFGKCGGCVFQNLDYKKQLEIKENYLIQTLEKIGGLSLKNTEIFPIIGSPGIWFYRNKMEFSFGEKNKDLILGLRERVSPFKKYSREVISLKKCFIFSECADSLFPMFLEFFNQRKLIPYDSFTRDGFLRHLVIREGKATGQVMAILVTRKGEIPELPHLVEKILEEYPRLKSFWWVINDGMANVVSYEKKKLVSGNPYILETLGESKFRIYPETFFQPNSFAAEVLYGRIKEFANLSEGQRVLGLYCGSGPIEIFLSPEAREIVGVDISPVNIQNAEENCRINKVENCSFISGRVERVLRKFDREKFDLLILDPPRAGLTPKALKLCLRMDIPRVIYTSCNPASLARDLNKFQEGRYSLKKLVGVDLFPHTGHLETISLLQRM